MKQDITWVGLDAHKRSIYVSVLFPGRKEAVEWQLANEPTAIRRMVRKILREASGEVRMCYEAGSLGYALGREIERAGEGRVLCAVVAPSLIPRKPGDRIKTDRRDARKLGELYRAGMLTEVCEPTEAEEAVRDLVRARDDAREDLMRARHRLGKLLLRRGVRSTPKAWTQAHRRWLRELKLGYTEDQAVLEDYVLAIEQIEERLRGLDQRLVQVSQQAPYADAVGRLRCFHGIDTLTAVSIVAEMHGFMRFRSPRELMAYLGLVPSEFTSSDRPRRGSITKSGNRHVRRLLIEASWHYRHRPSVGGALRKRREGQPAAIIAIADRAQGRLHRRQRRLGARGVPAGKVAVAVARELAGFVWAAMTCVA